jgi:curved DNA-binding protein CbpA
MAKERRRRPRNKAPVCDELHIMIALTDGSEKIRQVRLTDVSEWGVGFETSTPMVVGVKLGVWGSAVPGAPDENHSRIVQVLHCRLVNDEVYRAGCSLEDSPKTASPGSDDDKADDSFIDYYELLQVSANADADTIHRVYRMLAQRYHPDNLDTGDASSFQTILRAYQTFNDPARRAEYDIRYQTQKRARWRVFSKPVAGEGVQGEKRKRAAILSALYTKRVEAPEGAGVTLRELEELLGIPREHLDFSTWYLRRKGFVDASNNGRFEITADGVDAAEAFEKEGFSPRVIGEDHRLPAAPAQTEATERSDSYERTAAD